MGAVLLAIHGFFPTKWKEVVFGLGGTSHVEITEKAFEDRAKAYFPFIDGLTKKMAQARDEISDANAEVDDNQTEAHWHCDGESFPAAQARIAKLRAEAIAALMAEDAVTGRHRVGEAIHTIQDFYSHSNWIELGNTGPNEDLIRNKDMSAYTATFAETTCDSCSITLLDPFCSLFNCDANTNGFTKLTSGYYHGEDVPPKGVDIPSNKCHHGRLHMPLTRGFDVMQWPNNNSVPETDTSYPSRRIHRHTARQRCRLRARAA